MKAIRFVLVVVMPTQERAYVKSVSYKNGTFKYVKTKKAAKTYKSVDYVTYDIDALAHYVMQGYNFYYEEV